MSYRLLLGGKFFINASKKAECKLCGKEYVYKNGTSSLQYHLMNKHSVSSSSKNTKNSSGEAKQQTSQIQSRISSFTVQPVTPAKKNELSDLMLRWIVKKSRPLSMVDDPEFCDLMRCALGNEGYTPPSRRTITRKLTDKFDTYRQTVQGQIDSGETIHLTADHWTSLGNDSYMGVTAHYIDDSWALQSTPIDIALTEERHTGSQIRSQLEDICSDWKIDQKVDSITTDNARNMTCAMRELPQVNHLPCAAHTLQLCVNDSIADCNVTTLLAKCRKICGHVNHSPANERELKEFMQQYNEKEEGLVRVYPVGLLSHNAVVP